MESSTKNSTRWRPTRHPQSTCRYRYHVHAAPSIFIHCTRYRRARRNLSRTPKRMCRWWLASLAFIVLTSASPLAPESPLPSLLTSLRPTNNVSAPSSPLADSGRDIDCDGRLFGRNLAPESCLDAVNSFLLRGSGAFAPRGTPGYFTYKTPYISTSSMSIHHRSLRTPIRPHPCVMAYVC